MANARKEGQPVDVPDRADGVPDVSRFTGRQGIAGKAPADERDRLNRDLIFKVALELVDSEGADALSIRRLAQRLRCDPMTLYRHAANKSALLDGLTELVLAQLAVGPSDAPWADRLRAIARQFRELALAHPHVVPLLVTRPLATPLALRPPGTLRPLEDILELLIKAGFSPSDALYVYRALFGFLYGHVLNELQENAYNHDESDDLLRLGLYRLPVRDFPRIRSLASDLASYDGAAEFEDGLDGLLAGIDARCSPLRAETHTPLHTSRRPASGTPPCTGGRHAPFGPVVDAF